MTASGQAVEPRVSIVLLTYNRQDEVCATLARLKELSTATGPPPIIVVDNASTDGTAQRIADEYPEVQLIVSQTNLGAAGRNLGVQYVRTPYVAFSDDDTAWAPTALDTATEILDAHPLIAVLNAQILVGNEARIDPACDVMAASPLAEVDDVGPELIGFMAGACVMRTASFRDAGGYWPPLFIGGEETLLALDILERGQCIVYAPSVVTHHWPSSLRDNVRRRRLMTRNSIWTAWLRLPLPMAIRCSIEEFKNTPSLSSRLQLLADVLKGAVVIWRDRRCVNASVCARVERVSRSRTAGLKGPVHSL
ncbi:glycosyltransferase family 2 protein [Bordetella muralis]|uniref:glycosyltransferase family 2 protein n=1 Tax=Bordetella muralis TaxID=1649130 RepID=UPI0039EF6A8D